MVQNWVTPGGSLTPREFAFFTIAWAISPL